MGLDAIFFIFSMLSLKPIFSLSSFTFIKRLSSSSLFATKVVSSAYLRLLMFLPAILILDCASFSWAFHMRYSAYELNKQGDNLQPWCTPFPIWNQPIVSCKVLTVACCPAYRLLRRQVVVWYSYLFMNFPVCCDPHKGFSVVSEAEVDLGGGGGKEQFHSFFCDPMNVGNLISSSFAFSKSRLYIWKLSYCWSLTWRILSIILIACAMLCLVTQSCPALYDPMDYSPPGSSVHGDSPIKKEYWSELPCPPPGDLPNPGTEPRSSTMQADSLPAEPPAKPMNLINRRELW